MALTTHSSLLSSIDPYPVEVVKAQSKAPVLLLCEHAGNAIPQSLGNLGLDKEALLSHRGWDIGARALAYCIAERLGAPLILQRYSRLVIDGNRPPGSSDSILENSDGLAIAANKNLSLLEQEARLNAIFVPMDRAINEVFASSPRKAAFSIHSFTPVLDGYTRPWNAGFLTRKSKSTAQALIDSICRQRFDLKLAINEPYTIDDQTDWFIPVHAERRELPHCLIEVRNDQIADEVGVEIWAKLLGDALSDFMKSLS